MPPIVSVSNSILVANACLSTCGLRFPSGKPASIANFLNLACIALVEIVRLPSNVSNSEPSVRSAIYVKIALVSLATYRKGTSLVAFTMYA